MPPETPASPSHRPVRSASPYLTLAALATASLLAFLGLGNHSLWSDEADTALFARNLLRFGTLTAWDGTNLIAFAGGLDLDENLVNAAMPRQQYQVAALGLKILGDSVLAARAPFAAIGVLTLALTAWWARRFFGARFAWFLPPLLLALSPAYLLFIRNCRYYALGAFWTVLLFALWSEIAARPAVSGSSAKAGARLNRRALILAALTPLPAFGLFTSQYLYGAAALASLPVFFLEKRFRTRAQFVALGLVYGAGLLCILSLVLRGNPAETLLERRAGIGAFLGHWFKLLWWHIRDTGVSEFFALPMLAPLAFPWMFSRSRRCRPLAWRGLVLAAAAAAFLLIACLLSPQTFKGTQWADMRYVFPLIVPGALLGSVSLVILWRLKRWLAIAVALVLVTTNALHLGAHRRQKRHIYYDPPSHVRSTLLDYVREQFHPAQSTSDRLHDFLTQFPDGTRVWISPAPLATSSMFRLPRLHYCGLLDKSKPVRPELAASLPDYLYDETASPDVIIIVLTKLIRHADGSIEYIMVDKDGQKSFEGWVASPDYRPAGTMPCLGWDETRPDIPLRLFYEPPEDAKAGFGIWILVRKK